MKVQLRRFVRDLGQAGTVVEVTDAFARNFLLPHGLAVVATTAIITQVDRAADQAKTKKERHVADWQAVKQRLQHVTLRLAGRASPTGRLFAAIKDKEILAALAKHYHLKATGLSVIPDHLKEVGRHDLVLRWPQGGESKLTVEIDGQDDDQAGLA